MNESRLTLVDLRGAGAAPDFAADVREGLSSRPKRLSPRFFYDDAGSRLFEDITRAPEYYLTRTEAAILRRNVDEIAAFFASVSTLVELGSGSSLKTRLIIEALLRRRPALRYVAIDISRAALMEAAPPLLALFPTLRVTAVAADYAAGLDWLAQNDAGARKAVLYLGSSIGNCSAVEARSLLARVARGLGEGDRLLLGADLRKPARVLERAYNDAAGVTARFNLNLLRRINDELGGRFEPGAFAHRAFFNAAESRVEMHLESRRAQEVPVDALRAAFRFEPGETIHTEDSRKYELQELEALARGAELRRARLWLDSRRWCAVAGFERG